MNECNQINTCKTLALDPEKASFPHKHSRMGTKWLEKQQMEHLGLV